MATLRQADVACVPLVSGGWLLAVVHDGRRITARYFETSKRAAKVRFLADVKAGAV